MEESVRRCSVGCTVELIGSYAFMDRDTPGSKGNISIVWSEIVFLGYHLFLVALLKPHCHLIQELGS